MPTLRPLFRPRLTDLLQRKGGEQLSYVALRSGASGTLAGRLLRLGTNRRTDRLRIAGNADVPLQAAVAFTLLVRAAGIDGVDLECNI